MRRGPGEQGTEGTEGTEGWRTVSERTTGTKAEGKEPVITGGKSQQMQGEYSRLLLRTYNGKACMGRRDQCRLLSLRKIHSF